MKLGLITALALAAVLANVSTASAAKHAPVCSTVYVLGGTVTTCK